MFPVQSREALKQKKYCAQINLAFRSLIRTVSLKKSKISLSDRLIIKELYLPLRCLTKYDNEP